VRNSDFFDEAENQKDQQGRSLIAPRQQRGVLHAYQEHWFDYIISVSAKDRELTTSGIREMTPTGSTLEQLLDSISETIGFSELLELPLTQKTKAVKDLIRNSKILLFVDNLETIQDPDLINFIENLPLPVKAILTSRKARVRKAVFPVEVNEFELKEALTFLELVAARKGRDFVPDMPIEERKLIVENCFRIPLVIEWLIGSAKDEASVIEAARQLELAPRHAEEVLEFSFRRIHTGLSDEAQKVLTALSLFSEPQPVEVLHAACSIPFDAVVDALDQLLDTSLVIKIFDSGLNDTTYATSPITRRFARSELAKSPGLEQALRRALTVRYEGSDISQPEKRKVMVAIRKAQKDPETLLVDAAKEMRNQGKRDEAEEFLMQALQRNPASWRANRELGDFFKHEGNVTFALERYSKAASLAPKKGKDRALIFREYGILLRDAATPDALVKATEALEEALKETPNDPVCVYVLAQVLCRREMFQRAQPFLEGLARSEDRQSRIKAYPLLKRCYEFDRDLLKLSELRDSAGMDGFSI
jgi:tetratricopeptide (TPR) repeat protein